MKICGYCGTSRPRTANYCGQCGQQHTVRAIDEVPGLEKALKIAKAHYDHSLRVQSMAGTMFGEAAKDIASVAACATKLLVDSIEKELKRTGKRSAGVWTRIGGDTK
jgi:hypothetical protein